MEARCALLVELLVVVVDAKVDRGEEEEEMVLF